MNINKLTNNTILVVKSSQKEIIIQQIRKENPLLNIKFTTLNELRKDYYFNYNEKTIYYLIEKYQYKYDVAKKYLDNLYYLDSTPHSYPKLQKLQNLKKELNQHNLLIYNQLFKESLKNKKIIIYNHPIITKYDQKLINDLNKHTKVEIYNEKKPTYNHQYIYEFNDIESEVTFVANSIHNLIKNNIDPNRIKICGINDEYINPFKKIAKFYNIPIFFNQTTLYKTKIGQNFLKKLENNIPEALKYLQENYDLKDPNVLSSYNQIVKIINKYIWCPDLTIALPLIINDFKNQKINQVNHKKEITIIDTLEDTDKEDYVYLMSFNQGIIPKTYKDEDYLNNELKNYLNLDNTNDLNKNNHNTWLKAIKECKNLTITYKQKSPTGDFYISSLNDELNLTPKIPKLTFNYSHLYNKIKLTSNIDKLLKYNQKEESLELLYNNYKNINYMTYNNKYTKIDTHKLKQYLNNKLTLSYSAINNYYHCSFKYYLSNILKLNISEDTFYTILGNLFHYILSICFEKEIDLDQEYQNYLDKQTYQFNSREKFFLNNLKEELKFIINTIKKQYEYCTLTTSLYEEEIKINKSKNDMLIIFKGYVDKIMLDNNQNIAAIIDYKTGNPNLNLNNTIYGLDLQLPSYIYLTKHKFPNIRIVGFYLQKILNTEITLDNKHTYEYLKEDKLKLQGYTNSDENLITTFDSNYNESKTIKGMKTTSKGLGTKKILDDIKIDKLKNLTENKIDEAIDNILLSNFDINPKRVGINNIGCNYCTYKDICYMKEENIINLKEYKNMEFLEDN